MHQAGGLVIVSIAADLARFFSQLDPAARRSPPFRDRKFADSPLEGAGFESSVPRKAPGVVPKGSAWRVMQFDTLRLRLVKLAARVSSS
jgi:hypothetical protein